MEKKSYISFYQIVLLMLTTRLLFATAFTPALNAGNSLQDALPGLFVGLFTNFLVAIPILLLLRRHPGHDLVECAVKVFGRFGGAVVAVLYAALFLAGGAWTAGSYDNYFSSAVAAEARPATLNFLLVLICVYGAYKGIETIARFGSVTGVLYIATALLICLLLVSQVDTGLLKPMFYNGPGLFIKVCLLNYTLGIQAVLLAFFAPFLKPGKSLGKAYAWWNVIAVFAIMTIVFFVITVTGAAGARWYNGLQFLCTIISLSVFERFDGLTLVPWALTVILNITLYLYLAVGCLCKLGLNKLRLPLTVLGGAFVFFIAPFFASSFTAVITAFTSQYAPLISTCYLIVIPLLILIADVIKERILQSENNAVGNSGNG